MWVKNTNLPEKRIETLFVTWFKNTFGNKLSESIGKPKKLERQLKYQAWKLIFLKQILSALGWEHN